MAIFINIYLLSLIVDKFQLGKRKYNKIDKIIFLELKLLIKKNKTKLKQSFLIKYETQTALKKWKLKLLFCVFIIFIRFFK